MSTTVGSEYDHIDFTQNNITTRHPLKDATSREMVGDIVKIQDTAPQLEHNKIWIKETPGSEIQVPTYDEFIDLKSAIAAYIVPSSFAKGSVQAADGTVNDASPNVFYTDYIDIGSCKRFLYVNRTVASSVTHGMAFYNASKEYISGVLNSNTGTRGWELKTADVPESAKYARFTYWTDEARATYSISEGFQLYRYDETVAEKIYELSKYLSIGEYAYEIGMKNGYYIAYETGNESANNNFKVTDYINISGCKKIAYSKVVGANTSASLYGIAFYTDKSIEGYISGINGGNKATPRTVEIDIADVPQTAVYARFTYWSDTVIASDNMPSFVLVNYDNAGQIIEGILNKTGGGMNSVASEAKQMGLHTIPESRGVLNVIKRCRQYTDIKWTPAVDLPRCDRVSTSGTDEAGDVYNGKFLAGHEYIGLPYGRAYITDYGYNTTYFKNDITFETFVTAAQNKDSLVCKEASFNRYNKQSLPYAVVCSCMASYALNQTSYKGTSELPDVLTEKIGDIIADGTRIDLSLIKLGDFLLESGEHVSIITDIVKDENGNVVLIEESESAMVGNGNQSIKGGKFGGLCRRVAFNVDDFFDRYKDYELRRYPGIDSIPYTRSKFVNVGNEPEMARYDQLPCMPYPGERFKYRVGHIPNTKILVSCTGYSYMRVFKDGTEIEGSPFTITDETEYVEAGFSDIGSYEAYLCNMSGESNTEITARCHWSVVS